MLVAPGAGGGNQCRLGVLLERVALGAPRAGTGSASLSRAAAMWCGRTPQQPPMIWAPSSRQPAASSAYSAPPMRSSEAHPDSV